MRVPDFNNLKVKFYEAGGFHYDEVDENSDKKSWYGIFKGKKGYYLKETKMKIKTFYDDILDTHGWNISAHSKRDACWFL